MGEIADMMLDGTICHGTGEWNFGGEDGPGFPLNLNEAQAFWRTPPAEFKMGKRLRSKVEKFGELRQCDTYHWQVRGNRRVIADWWPHKRKWRMDGKTVCGDETAFLAALAKANGEAPQ